MIQREEVEDFIGPLSDAQWSFLEGSDPLRDAEQGSVSFERFAAQVREVFPRPAREREPAPRVIQRDDLSRQRAHVVSLLLAVDAAGREDVQTFRSDALGGELLPRDGVEVWVRAREDVPTVWVRVPVSRDRLQVNPDGIRIKPALRAAELRDSWSEQKYLRYLDEQGEPQLVATTAGGALDALRELGEALANSYGWTREQSTVFLLTDAVPLLEEIRVHATIRSLPATSRIVLEVDPNMRPARVQKVYGEQRKRLLARRPRPLGEKSLALARFLAESDPTLTWRERLPIWNRIHPEWAYPPTNVQNFHRDAVAAQRRLLTGRVIVPPA